MFNACVSYPRHFGGMKYRREFMVPGFVEFTPEFMELIGKCERDPLLRAFDREDGKLDTVGSGADTLRLLGSGIKVLETYRAEPSHRKWIRALVECRCEPIYDEVYEDPISQPPKIAKSRSKSRKPKTP